jgi:hypothetical protein
VLALTQLAPEVAPAHQQLQPFFGLLQTAGGLQLPQWLPAAQQQLAAAVCFAASVNAPVASRILQVCHTP